MQYTYEIELSLVCPRKDEGQMKTAFTCSRACKFGSIYFACMGQYVVVTL